MNELDYQNYLEIIKYHREYLNITQKQLALIIGMTSNQYSKCERGERKFSVIHFVNVCNYLNINIH